MLDTCILNRKPPPLIDLVSIKTQAKRKISPAGVALSMVPILGTSSQIAISASVKESNMANEKYKIAKIKGRKHRTFQHLRFKFISLSNRVAAVRLPISKERVHLVRMHQARTRYIILHYKMVSFLRCQIMFMSNHVRILKLSGVDPHRLCRPLSHIEDMGLLAAAGITKAL